MKRPKNNTRHGWEIVRLPNGTFEWVLVSLCLMVLAGCKGYDRLTGVSSQRAVFVVPNDQQRVSVIPNKGHLKEGQ